MTQEPRRLKVYIYPEFGDKADPGDGGVRRVVEAQRRYLPGYGIDVVATVEEADVLAAHMVAPPAVYRSGKPFASHNHGFYWSEYDWSGNWAGRDNAELMRAIRRSDAVTAPSQWVANIIRRHTSRDVEAIYHGVDETPGLIPNEGYVLWNKTRVDPICDPTPVGELALRLRNVSIHTTFYPGDPAPANVTVLGRQPYLEAQREVAAAGVYLCTARETFGIGTLEALAAGVPVVGFAWGGQVEIVEHMKDGYLARPGDFDDLARGVMWALQHREAISGWARAKAQLFTWDKPMRQYAEMYYRIADYPGRYDLAIEDHQLVHKDWPRVSIVVTAYNLARYLPACLASVQTQSEKNWECIIVDDASPDDCGRIADEWAAKDPRFRVIHNDSNEYLSEARNIGIRAARASYVLPLDADDMLTPTTVDILANALDLDHSIATAYGGVRFVDEDGVTPTSYGSQLEPGYSGWPHPYDFATMLARPGQPLPYASMFRREAWRQTGGYRRRVRSSEDCDFWVRLGSYGFDAKMVTQAPTLIYRNRADSMSNVGGWADDENKRWFPWRGDVTTAPAAGQPGSDVRVPALDPPLVSVIIPVGPEHWHLVADAVDSVEAQSFREWEVIVVNDTGRELPELPAWVKVVDAREGEWYQSLEHKGELVIGRAAGVVEARNKGLAIARGVTFLPLDADDYLLPDALATLVAAWRQSDRKTVIYADFWQTPETGGEDFSIGQVRDFDCAALLQGALHSVTALTPMRAWRDVGGFDANVPWEDWDFQFKLYTAGWCGQRIAAPLWVYRKHTGSRRLDRYNRREAGKVDVLAKWGDYIEGRKDMPCTACGTRTIYSSGGSGGNVNSGRISAPPGMEDPQLMQYVGELNGGQDFRGQVTHAMYRFQRGRPRYVDARDLPYFLQQPDKFALGAGIALAETPVGPISSAPRLVAHEPGSRLTEVAGPPAATPPFMPLQEVDVGRGAPLVAQTATFGAEDLPPPPAQNGDWLAPPPAPAAAVAPALDPELGDLPSLGAANRPAVHMPTLEEATAALIEPPPIATAGPVQAADVIPDAPDAASEPVAPAADLVRVPVDDAGNEVDLAAVAAAPARTSRPRRPAATANPKNARSKTRSNGRRKSS